MNKDVHLLEIALATDRTIASKDVEAHDCFEDACHDIGEIRDIMWVNPDREPEFCLDWLRRGAPVETARQLGYQHRSH